jgi:hypothetical protein
MMSHLCTSLALALKRNTEHLDKKSSSGFRDYVKQITTKTFLGKQSGHLRHVKFAMKKAVKMVKNCNHLYLVNPAMQEELTFISHALVPDSGIKFKTPIVAHLIPRIPTASIFGDSSLLACSGYSITLGFWWHLTFPEDIVGRTLLGLNM